MILHGYCDLSSFRRVLSVFLSISSCQAKVCVCVRACDARVDSRPQTAFGSRSMAGTIPRPCWLGLLRQVLGPACVLDLSVMQVFGVARWEHACRGAHAASVFALSAGAVSFGQIVKALAMRIAGQLVQFQFSQELSKII